MIKLIAIGLIIWAFTFGVIPGLLAIIIFIMLNSYEGY